VKTRTELYVRRVVEGGSSSSGANLREQLGDADTVRELQQVSEGVDMNNKIGVVTEVTTQEGKPATKTWWRSKNVWVREDRQAKTFRTTLSSGPDWEDVYKRDTYDMDSGDLLESLEVVESLNRTQLYKQMPNVEEGGRNIRTELFVREGSGSNKVKKSKTVVPTDDDDEGTITKVQDWMPILGTSGEETAVAELVSAQDILASGPIALEEWKQAFSGELDNHAALLVHNDIDSSEANRLVGLGAEILPAKIVATLKPPDRKKKGRVVVCGNFAGELEKATQARWMRRHTEQYYQGQQATTGQCQLQTLGRRSFTHQLRRIGLLL